MEEKLKVKVQDLKDQLVTQKYGGMDAQVKFLNKSEDHRAKAITLGVVVYKP